jgi:2-keto-4-pentenoate hydratase/2-oxohepta-3-ene-1,7-dioic acid hydratase in catechol pathway
MQLVTFEVTTPIGNFRRLGLWRSPSVIDLNLAFEGLLAQNHDRDFSRQLAGVVLPSDMIQFFKAGSYGKEAAAQVEHQWEKTGRLTGPDGQTAVFNQSQVKFLAPVPRPNTIRDFSTFEEHQKKATRAKGNSEVPEVWYRMPVYWKANPENTAGPDEDILWPSYSNRLDFELELGVLISKTGRDIPVEQAGDYIAGYTIFNDISARDQQAEETVMTFGPAKGKDFDTAKVIGPCLVTPDEFGAGPHTMKARINGEQWSEGIAEDMYWSFAQLISYVSKCETLKPGDLLGSGACPTGCGLEINRWVQPGDTIELEVEKIGILRNKFVKKEETR